MKTNLDTALRLARAGLYVFPCDPTTKRPRLPNNESNESWKTLATNEPDGVRHYWGLHGADSMPGLALGLCGLFAIDIDVKGGVDGCAVFDELLDRYGPLPPCPAVRTPSDGFHFILRQPYGRAPLGNALGALPKFGEVRGVGGYLIAPGSVRSDGTFYEAVPGWPELVESYLADTIPEVPDWIVELIEQPKHFAAAERGPSTFECNDRRGREWALGALSGCANELAFAKPGMRNGKLNVIAFKLGRAAARGWLSEDEIGADLWAACLSNGLVADDGEHAFRATFWSGLRAGLLRPAPDPRERLSKIDPKFLAGLKPRAA